MDSRRVVITSVLALALVLSTLSSAMGAGFPDKMGSATSFIPGKLQTVKGSVSMDSTDITKYINPDRPSRFLGYQLGARQAYRAGVVNSYTLRKEAREQTRTDTTTGSLSIKGVKTSAFKKNAPELSPYPVESNLRQQMVIGGRAYINTGTKLNKPSPSVTTSTVSEGGSE